MNKKVLLRERKRYTDRGISITPSVILYEVGYPPSGYPQPGLTGGIWGGVPPFGYPPSQGTPTRSDQGGTWGGVPPCQGTPCQVWQGVPKVGYPPVGVPPCQVRWGVPEVGYPPHWGTHPLAGWTWPGYPLPRRCGLTNKVKLLPSLSYYVRGR